jgi:catechol 2,3-dioxygenase-like lactoylglutathione lyase family enzyme
MATLTLTTVTLDTPDPPALARFYAALLSGRVGDDEPDWSTVDLTDAPMKLAFQLEHDFVRPTWPAAPGAQQMMLHLEIKVDDLVGATEHARSCGATVAEFQPQDDVRVCLDPDGHPFCLWTER